MSTIKPHCYSQRMLNPFRGVMNVIDLGNADAVTLDGVEWTLYLRDEALQGMANDGDMAVETIDIRFGSWTAKNGLKRAPLLTTMEYDAIQHAGEVLLQVVKEYAGKVPFPLSDNYELWLLDTYMDQPLALLHSVCFSSDLFEPDTMSWTPGLLCRETFQSKTLESRLHGAKEKLNHAAWLASQVNQASGVAHQLQWFFRRADGSGVAVSPFSGKPVMGAGIVSLEDFPGLLLRRDWVDSQMTNIIQEFISWQAPWLLLLQGISDDIRNELEKFACKYSRRLALNQRLYPKVINQDSIRAALVEARLRVANEISDVLQPAINDPSHQIAGQYY